MNQEAEIWAAENNVPPAIAAVIADMGMNDIELMQHLWETPTKKQAIEILARASMNLGRGDK